MFHTQTCSSLAQLDTLQCFAPKRALQGVFLCGVVHAGTLSIRYSPVCACAHSFESSPKAFCERFEPFRMTVSISSERNNTFLPIFVATSPTRFRKRLSATVIGEHLSLSAASLIVSSIFPFPWAEPHYPTTI